MTSLHTPDETTLDELDGALQRLRRFGGDALLRDLIDLFLEHTPARIQAARAAIATGDLRPAQLAVHSLASSSAQLGAEHMRSIAAEAERAVAHAPAALPPLLDALEHELGIVRPLLLAARPPVEAAS